MATLPANLPDMASANLPATYEAAQRALAECASIDECQTWADKMAVLASYAKQANDDKLHRLAIRIRARAIRRCGELLQAIKPKHTGRPPENGAAAGPNSRKSAARDAGLSERQRKTALRVAGVEKSEFEAAVESDEPPIVTKLAERGTKRALIDLGGRDPKEFSLATQTLGNIRRLAEFAAAADPAAIVRGMFPKDHKTIREPIEVIEQWLAKLKREIAKHERKS